jgi:hypothetical protein
MAQVLAVYKEVQQARDGAIRCSTRSSLMMENLASQPLQTSLPIWRRSVENRPHGVEIGKGKVR